MTAADVPGERTQGSIDEGLAPVRRRGRDDARTSATCSPRSPPRRRAAAREAAALVEVEYEVLEPVTDPFEALTAARRAPRGGNVLSVSRVQRGDVDAALAGAAHVVTETFRTQFIEHAFLEPESALAVPGRTTGRCASTRRARASGRTAGRSRPSSACPRSACASRRSRPAARSAAKEDLNVQCHAALLARVTGRPVLRHAEPHARASASTPSATRCGSSTRSAATRTASSSRVRARIVGDTGAYASVGDKVLERAAGHACGAYRVPNVDVEATAVYTNNPPCGAMRGFGVNQANFAIEGVLDLLAERGRASTAGRSAGATRSRSGDRFGTGQRLGPGVGLKKTLLAVQDAYREAPLRRASPAASRTPASATAWPSTAARSCGRRPTARSRCFHSWTEMGQGVHTVLHPDRLRGARPAARARARRGRHRARARHRPDHGVARRPCSAAAP